MKKLALILAALTLTGITGCAQLQKAQAEFVNPGSTKQTTTDPETGESVARTMTPAKMDDPALEESMVAALADAGWKEDVRAITITAADWDIKYHPVSGVITHRVIPTDVVTHLEGKSYCRLFSLSFKQDHNGNDFGVTKLNGTGNSFQVDCEKAITTDN